MLISEFAAQQATGVIGNAPQPLFHGLGVFFRPGFGIIYLLAFFLTRFPFRLFLCLVPFLLLLLFTFITLLSFRLL